LDVGSIHRRGAALEGRARHLVRCRAVLHSLGDDVALSHGSGLIVHDAEIWGARLSHVHVTRLDGDASRIEGDVVHHRGTVHGGDAVVVEGMLRPARCAVEYAATVTSESAFGQCEIRDETGMLRATCDVGWPELNAYGEFDGRVKHGRLLRPGQDPGDVVFMERQREAPSGRSPVGA
jgi:hypothetical protein